MTLGTRVRVNHRGLEYHNRKGVVDHLFHVDGCELLAIKLDDGRIFGLPAIWVKPQ